MIIMKNELITLNETTALSVMSSTTNTDQLIADVKAKVSSLEGGSMKTATGRKQIRSNAFKATKSKGAVKKLSMDLIEQQEAKIAPTLLVIQSIKDNFNTFAAGMDKIRKDTNEDVDAFEAELKRVEDEKIWSAMLEEAYNLDILETERIARQKEQKFQFDHMEAIVFNMENDKRIADEIEASRLRDEQIAINAAAKATKEAEEKALAESNRLKLEKQQAIDAQKEAEAETKRQQQAAIVAEEEAEQLAIEKQQAEKEAKEAAELAEKRAKIQAEEASKKAIEDQEKAVAQAVIDEQNKVDAEEKAAQDILDTKMKNSKHRAKIKGIIKAQLMEAGLPQDMAIKAVNAMVKPTFTNLTINY